VPLPPRLCQRSALIRFRFALFCQRLHGMWRWQLRTVGALWLACKGATMRNVGLR
jgi:hypothetical protein